MEDAVERAGTGDLVISMTIWRLAYYREIMDGLKGAAEVRPFRLTASESTLRDRIERDRVEPGAVAWRMDRLATGIQAFEDTAFGDHVGTDVRTPEKGSPCQVLLVHNLPRYLVGLRLDGVMRKGTVVAGACRAERPTS